MDQWFIGGVCWEQQYDTSAPDHPNDVGCVTTKRQEVACLSVICVLFCVIVLSVRVEFDHCTFVSIDKRSPSLNKAGFHCFVLRFYTFVNERRSYRG
ncbi:hypothetical protein T11_2358 [Trichinella zimbabwensis]|uniref:Uncharacterized protein n=1 Tax=Trichinella zimbabwensis TaxID=268475 RepID=A0A0V1GR02_9BILA|nr:hypothetical protein T11_2358 [Trichinella zimbabwensis]